MAERTNNLTLKDIALRMLGLGVIDAVALWFTYVLLRDGLAVVAIVLVVVTILINWVFLSDKLYPVRWLTPGLLLMLLMVVYPLIFTIYVSLTNYSDGHILTKEQVIAQLQGRYYQPKDATSYKWTAYRNPSSGKFIVVLQDPQGKYYTASEEEGVKPLNVSGELPDKIGDYEKVDRIQSLKYLGDLEKLNIKSGDNLIRVSSLDTAKESRRQYTFDPSTDKLTDTETNTVYTPVRGTFTAPNGKTLDPGFATLVGLDNFLRIINDNNIKAPFFAVFVWTFVFAALSVLLTFALGLAVALLLNDKDLPFRGLFRSIAIIPYAIPAFISALIWVGLLNPLYGQVNGMLRSLFGISPDWFSDGTWAKAGILLINTWLGFPYMMLLCLGALQAIPTDMYEAANIDGAPAWVQFRSLTLPLLLVSVAPLLIGSFAFNFNNFTLIDIYAQGGPPIAGASTPAGQTDILISYTYRLAFGGGQGADYGLASAIALFIFTMVALITSFNFRYTRQLEEVT